MSEPLTYKQLEEQIKGLLQSKQQMAEEFAQKERINLYKTELFQQLANQTNEGILLIQADTIKFANQTALLLLECSAADLQQKKFSETIEPNYQGQAIKGISRVIGNELDVYSDRLELITFTQKILTVQIIVERLKGQAQQNSLMVKIDNITSQKQQGEEREAVAKLLSLYQQYSGEGFIVLQKISASSQNIDTWQIISLNEQTLKLVEKPDFIAENNLLVNLLETGIKLPDDFDNTYEEAFELQLQGQKKWLFLQLNGLNSKQVVIRLTENTELVETKSQLAKNLQQSELFTEILNLFNTDVSYEDKFKLVLEKIGFNIKARRIVLMHNSPDNKLAMMYQQYAGNEADLLHDDFAVSFLHTPSYKRLLDEKRMILGFSLQYLPEDLKDFLSQHNFSCAYIFPIIIEKTVYGSLIFENYQHNPWDNSEIGFMRMITVLVANLTTRQVNEEKLMNAKNKAEEADRLKSSFLANMSHDIRIPMTAIIGFSDLLADPDLTIGEREEFIELISKSGQDLLTLIDNIVDMSKIETGQLKLQLDRCSLGAMFKDLTSMHSKNNKIIMHDDLELILDLKESYRSLPFETDVFRLKQIFSNLIDNAIKFTDKGVIRFGISNNWGNTVEFFVQDSGIGIAEETQSIIFERFSKIDHTYTKEYTGTGLGLAICKSLVELMGGEIRVVSYLGKGSTFYFTHPLIAEGVSFLENQIKTEEQKKSPFEWTDKTIVVVEDVEQNYKYLEYILFPTNAKVVWIKNGKEAVDYFVDRKPADAVLMDIRLPIMNGIEATKEIVKLSTVPIIAQTAYTLGDEKQMALSAGCIGYISKPVNGQKLLTMLEGLFKQLML